MVEENLEVRDSSLSSPKSVQNSQEPKPTEGTNEDDNNNLEKTVCANFEIPMHQELPASFILIDDKSNLQEISVDQIDPFGDSIICSSEVDYSELPSIKEDSLDPKPTEGTNEDDNSNLEKTVCASFEIPMHQELPASLILIDDKSNLQKKLVEQKAPFGDSIIGSLEVDYSGLPSIKEDSLEPKPTEGTNEDDNSNLEKTVCANFEIPMHQELPASLILIDEKSNLQEISVEQKAPFGDSIIGSSEVDYSGLPSIKDDSLEPKSTEGINADENSNLEKTVCANFEIPMHQELPASLILVDEKSNLQEVLVAQKAPFSDSMIGSSKVDYSGLPSIKEDSLCFPSASDKVDESKEAINDLMTMQSLEENTHAMSQTPVSSREEVQCAPLHNVQDGAFCSDSEKTACEVPPATPPAILQKVKEDKSRFMHRFPDRQMSLRDTRQKMPAPVRRLNSGNYSRTDNYVVDTTKPIESVKVAASRFGGSINWKTRKTEPVQVGDHVKLEVSMLNSEISDCKQQAEAAEAAKLSVFSEIERTKKLIEDLKHDLERAEHEEAHAKEDLDFFQFIVPEMEEGVSGDDSVAGEEILKNIQERHRVLVSKLKLVNDELKRVQEDYDSLLIEHDISVGKSQAAIIVSKETERQVEELAVELNKLKEVLDLARAMCHEAEEHKACTSLDRDEDRLKWEKDLRQAEEELSQLNKKLSSVEDLKSELETSSNLLVKRNQELTAYVEAKLIKEAQEERNRTHEATEEETILSRNELKEHMKSIDKVRDEVCTLKVAAASLQSELSKEKEALSSMQQLQAMSSITISSLKAEIKLAEHELETVQAKEKKSRGRMSELHGILQAAAQEADEAKSVAMKAHEMLRMSKEEMEQAKADLSTMEFRLQAVLKEMEAAKESERLSLVALRALEESEFAVSIAEQGSPEMITLDFSEHASLIEKSHQAEELVHEKVSFAIAQVEMAKESESLILSELSEVYKVLEERKQALLAAEKQSDSATEGKLAIEQELRTWREEHGQRRKASEASKSETKHSNTVVIIVERSGDTKCTGKEDSCAVVHPLSDTSARSSPSGVPEKMRKAKKPPFLRRMMKFLARRRLKAAA